VHVRIAGGRNVRYALLFRDFLRADQGARDAWGAFKLRLAESVADVYDYGQIKASIQPLLMERADQWAAETGWRSDAARTDDGPPVMGVDGCRSGWVGAVLRGSTFEVLVAADIRALVVAAREREPDLRVVGVDIPIGLPDDGARTTDVLARERLPVGRKSSVFPAPSRAATGETTYVGANAANRLALGKGLSRQAFGIVPRILDVDAYVRSAPPVAVLETHPEVSFAEIDPACVVPSKTTPVGAAARTAALRSVGLEPPAYLRGQGYAADDLLDACVVAWTAARYAAGTAYSLPDPPEVCSDGLPAAIWV
jgi:predicted RNase H-like nuclease